MKRLLFVATLILGTQAAKRAKVKVIGTTVDPNLPIKWDPGV